LRVALQKEQTKLIRQKDAISATKAYIGVVGESEKEVNKLARQEAAARETQDNIAKIEAALK
jgi:hypothetical protein